MANEQNYIGVAMGLDVTDLKAGLSEANKQIQLANSEFRSASSGMDDWTKSIEGVSAKVKQLDTVLGAQKAKLAGLTAEYEKVAKEQGAGSEAARKLKVQINNQQAVVNATQKEFDNYSETLKQAKSGVLDLEKASLRGGKAVQDMGENAKDSGEGFTVMKGAMANLVSTGITTLIGGLKNLASSMFSLAGETQEYREDMARLDAAFEASGKTADSAKNTYNELYRAIGESDTAVEASQQIALLAKSEEDAAKWADLATGVVGTFGDALKPETFFEAANETIKLGEATGAFTQMLEGTGMSVDEFNAGLAACTTEQEKQAYMLKISEQQLGAAGKAYEEQAGGILDAREASANLTDALAELGAIAEPIMTVLKTLAAELLTEIQPFVELIGTGLMGAFNGTAGATDTLAQGLSGLLSTIAEKATQILPGLISTLGSLASTLLPQILSTVAGLIPSLISTLAAQLPTILTALLSGFSQILTEIGRMLPSLIPVVIDAVLTVVETLLDNVDMLIDSGISLLMGLADGLIAALPRLIDKIPVIIDKLIGALSRNMPKLVQAGIELILKLAAGLIKAIPQLLSKIPEIISSLVGGFSDYYSKMGEVGLELLKGIWQGIKDGAGWLKDKIFGFADDVAGWFKETFKISSPSKLMEDEVGVFVGQGVVPTSPRALRRVKKSLNRFSDYVSDNLGGIKGNLALSASGAGGSSTGGRSTVIDARQTINYNGKLSRKEIRRQRDDHYTSVKTKLKAEGAI